MAFMVRGKARDRRNKPKPKDVSISTQFSAENISLQDAAPPLEETVSVSQESTPPIEDVEFLQDIDSSKGEELSLSTDTISDNSLPTTENPTMAVVEKTLTTTVTSSYQSAVVMMKRKKR